MRIKSTFHDYYDVVMGDGQDRTLLYVRKPVEVPVGYGAHKQQLTEEQAELAKDIPNFPPLPGRSWRRTKLTVDSYVVGFCGKIYPVLALTTMKSFDPVFCFNVEQVDKFIGANFHKKEIEDYHASKSRWSRRNRWSAEVTRKSFVKCFAEFVEKQDHYADFFEEKKCPIFIRDNTRSTITFNGCLRELEFVRVIEPYTAFQELAMFWGGMAQPNRPIPEVTDKDMVTAKGFDKYSFRKEKSKK